MFQGQDDILVAIVIGTDGIAQSAGGQVGKASLLHVAEEQQVDRVVFRQPPSHGGGLSCLHRPLRGGCPFNLLGVVQLLHGLPGPLLVPPQLIIHLPLLDGQPRDEPLDPLDIVNVQVDLLLQNIELLIHLYLQIVPTCLNLRLQLMHLLLHGSQEGFPLLLGVLISHLLHPELLLHFQIFELLPIVHCLFNPLIDCHQLLIILHFPQLRRWLDLHCLHSPVELQIQHLHLGLMLPIQLLDLAQTFLLKVSKVLVPLFIEFLQLLLSYLDVLPELVPLDVGTQVLLVLDDVQFQLPDLLHKIFE
mmetsp:Transcript_44038/g.42616  ORF Transcript_44038/g.42616 Transcript_44038/m.42616 type:complete len:304 (-) Transcript_44038:449-1360(-)